MDQDFIVAVKDSSSGKILPGRMLGSFRKIEYAQKQFSSLVRQAGFAGSPWKVGIFHQNKLVS